MLTFWASPNEVSQAYATFKDNEERDLVSQELNKRRCEIEVFNMAPVTWHKVWFCKNQI